MEKVIPSEGDRRGHQTGGVNGKSTRQHALLSDFLQEPDEPLEYRVDGLMTVGSRVLLSAQAKSGKSVLTHNLIRSLVDGEDFLGKYPVTPPSGRVVLLDAELDKRMLRRWLRDQKIQNDDQVVVIPLRGRTSSFNILNADFRQEWAEKLREMEASVVVLDCLRPVLDSLGVDEDKDAGKFLVAFDELLALSGAEEAVVVHHMGHTGERARGSSRLLDWPDALWKLVSRDQDPLRYITAFGRDVDVPEEALLFQEAGRRLSFLGGSRQDRSDTQQTDAVTPALLKLVEDQPALTGRRIEETLTNDGLPQKGIRFALSRAVDSGLIRREGSRTSGYRHYLVETVRQGASEVRQRTRASCVSASIGTHTHTHAQTRGVSDVVSDARTEVEAPRKVVKSKSEDMTPVEVPRRVEVDGGYKKPRVLPGETEEEALTRRIADLRRREELAEKLRRRQEYAD